ncbi:hypothetical protein JCM8097_005335 [Rhodosporidiobolus ruineniae]
MPPLPPELVTAILRRAAPLDYSPSSYKIRRATLRSCSLVSRTFRDVAQPMLGEVFEVGGQEDVDLLAVEEKEGKARGSLVKLLVLRGEEGYGLVCDKKLALERCPNVVDLRLSHAGDFELDWLVSLSSLRRLVISNTTLDPPSSGTSLPSIIELSFFDTYYRDDDFLEHFPTPVVVSNLRGLGLGGLTGDYAPELEEERDAVDSTPFKDLEVLVERERDGEYLCWVTILPQTEAPAQELHIPFENESDKDYLAERVKSLYITASWFPLTRISLPSLLNSPSSVEEREAVEGLVATTAPRGVKVVYDEEPEDWTCTSLITPAVWQRTREEKAQRGMRAVPRLE